MCMCVSTFVCVCFSTCVHVAHLQCCVINDSRGEWTSAVSPFWLFWADLVWVGRSGHKASGDLKILGYSLTCTSASALRECSFYTRTHIQSPGKDTHCLLSFFPTLCWKSLSERPNWLSERPKHRDNQTYINILSHHRSTKFYLSHFHI